MRIRKSFFFGGGLEQIRAMVCTMPPPFNDAKIAPKRSSRTGAQTEKNWLTVICLVHSFAHRGRTTVRGSIARVNDCPSSLSSKKGKC